MPTASRPRQDVVARFPHTLQKGARVRATTLLSRGTASVVPRRKKGDKHPPRVTAAGLVPAFRGPKNTIGGASALGQRFSHLGVLDVRQNPFKKKDPKILIDELCV
ncbi:hypothetical protein TNIN_264381 [Trichonephila inaurata madagascariensis]|uniref:Uncharacterized protein n=1 Tax=Trichonephila inaurata madagascariensis TaxID=2747483 RepID=A0A8X6XGW8_9ARAC|nr:hypothetical protein TNIN_264381 [Trichonephila inaurata madagascariensis]